MKRTNRPTPVAGVLCALLGVVYASAIGGLLHSAPPSEPPPPAPARIPFATRMSQGPTGVAATPSAPLKLETVRPAPRPRTKTGQSLQSHSKEPVLSSMPLANSSPVPDPRSTPSTVTAPAPEAPPAHAEELGTRIYPEQPGGPTLVLALLVNGAGEVLAVKVMVPSAYPLQDVNYPLLLIGRKFSPPQPPLAPGQTRWIDLRIHYTSGTAEIP